MALNNISAVVDNIEARLDALIAAAPEHAPKPLLAPKETPLPLFQTKGLHPSVARAHEAALAWFSAVRDKATPYWLTLFGRSGCGKSLLCKHVARALRDRTARRYMLRNWGALTGDVLGGNYALLSYAKEVPILILDDVGADFSATEKQRTLRAGMLYDILEARRSRWTMLTSNLSPAQLAEAYDPRCVSRLGRKNAKGELNVLVDLSEAEDYCWALQKATGNIR